MGVLLNRGDRMHLRISRGNGRHCWETLTRDFRAYGCGGLGGCLRVYNRQRFSSRLPRYECALTATWWARWAVRGFAPPPHDDDELLFKSRVLLLFKIPIPKLLHARAQVHKEKGRRWRRRFVVVCLLRVCRSELSFIVIMVNTGLTTSQEYRRCRFISKVITAVAAMMCTRAPTVQTTHGDDRDDISVCHRRRVIITVTTMTGEKI